MSTILSIDCKDPKVKRSIQWLLSELGSLSYGEIMLSFTLHDGQVKSIDKATKEKQRNA